LRAQAADLCRGRRDGADRKRGDRASPRLRLDPSGTARAERRGGALVATLMSEIDCSKHTTREINQAIKQAAADGVTEVRLTNPAARHCLAVAVMRPVRVVFDGPVGWYCGGMCDGADIVINGNCGWSVGENLMSGSITVHGNGGSSAAATTRGGRVFIEGDTGARTGISMKGGTLVVGGSVGYMSGFMMQRGTMIVCGDAADGIGDSM